MSDEYHTIRAESLVEIKVQGSRFKGEAIGAVSTLEAQSKLDQIRKREHAATHHCYAWRVGHDQDMAFKYSDDGEPNGTAGRPIYDAIVGADLTDTIVVVTRYFGGTKLGTGGLAHAYSDAARLALEQAGRSIRYVTGLATVTLEFSLYDRWLKLLQKMGAAVVDAQFADRVTMQIEIRLSRFDELQRTFVELTSGKGQIEITPTSQKKS
jgi:uncharacterized YigZ family protein